MNRPMNRFLSTRQLLNPMGIGIIDSGAGMVLTGVAVMEAILHDAGEGLCRKSSQACILPGARRASGAVKDI